MLKFGVFMSLGQHRPRSATVFDKFTLWIVVYIDHHFLMNYEHDEQVLLLHSIYFAGIFGGSRQVAVVDVQC